MASLATIVPELKQVQVMIIAPTRELARQIYSVVSTLSKYIERLPNSAPYRRNVNRVGYLAVEKQYTPSGGWVPGTYPRYAARRHINSQHIKLLVIDEADEMLSVGSRNRYTSCSSA